MARRRTTRQLIQFSTYSIALVLPKKILRALNWKAGECVEVRLDPTKPRLIVVKSEDVADGSVVDLSETPKKSQPTPPKQINGTPPAREPSEEIRPIPEIDA